MKCEGKINNNYKTCLNIIQQSLKNKQNCIIGPCWYMMEITDIIKIKFLTIYKFIFIDHIHNIKKPSFNCLFLNASRTGVTLISFQMT